MMNCALLRDCESTMIFGDYFSYCIDVIDIEKDHINRSQ